MTLNVMATEAIKTDHAMLPKNHPIREHGGGWST